MRPGGRRETVSRSMAERLHDGPLQIIAALRLKLMVLEAKGSANQQELAELEQLTIDVQEELANLVRTLARSGEVSAGRELSDLSAVASEEASQDLSERLRKLCATFRAGSGIDCQLLVIPAHTKLPSTISLIVYRAIRELLTNVHKHAQAKNVEVSSTVRDDGSVVFSVRDDGIGLVNPDAPWQVNEGGFGLWSIVHRLREIGAFLESENDSGVCFNIVLPAQSVAASYRVADAQAS